ncbi:glycosyltransferase family A protein [Beijerinckia indica]|uniref:Glycosyl transferase family 2 n=1 Tax=Beijerinckia indica subsp. indica (strain ATCC 9039 / DSM 1715 / NCIMB 8712) TaxID=395963 RepID=B2IB49_BEII9|nr:glycosyltransferase family A protein [Beijerinckia indica]ACB93747.1 glycosyl transferase family 2 [Beijerinckia indica subsp. indica ATCC 9039]
MQFNHQKRYLVVTAYYKEDRSFLERCIRSVREQTMATDHLLVADGFAQDWVQRAGLRHIQLDQSHNDYGNTPRGIGALLAISERYDGFCFCDADNWFEPNHIASCLQTAADAEQDCDYVVARRYLRRPDETIIPINDEPIESHVDTNCFFFLPGSYHLVHLFANMPQELSSIGDRVFYNALRRQKLNMAVVHEPTVNYHCLWKPVYQAIGEIPPLEGKPSIDNSSIQYWISNLNPRQKELLSRRTGLSFG